MTVVQTTNAKKFVWDRVRHVVTVAGLRYFLTGSGNVVRENADGTYDEIPRATVEANILLLPYDLAAEMFPDSPVLVETI